MADRLGLNPTDHKCIDLMASAGSTTAGELAEATGLTTGAITGVIDRLEAAGFVRREDDPTRPSAGDHPGHPRALSRHRPAVRAVGAKAVAELGARYSERELATIVDFMTRSGLVLREATLGAPARLGCRSAGAAAQVVPGPAGRLRMHA